MTVQIIKGNIFDSNAHYIVIPVNCVGVMGAGLARQFAETFPNTAPYIRKKIQGMAPGMYIKDHTFIFATTKDHWKDPSKKEWIVDILYDFKQLENASIAIPPLGCGLGGLDKQEFYTVAKWFLEDKPNLFEIWDIE